MRKYKYKLNVGKTYNSLQENEKSSPRSKLVGVKWCEIHKEWFLKDLMVPMGTELNNVIND